MKFLYKCVSVSLTVLFVITLASASTSHARTHVCTHAHTHIHTTTTTTTTLQNQSVNKHKLYVRYKCIIPWPIHSTFEYAYLLKMTLKLIFRRIFCFELLQWRSRYHMVFPLLCLNICFFLRAVRWMNNEITSGNCRGRLCYKTLLYWYSPCGLAPSLAIPVEQAYCALSIV